MFFNRKTCKNGIELYILSQSTSCIRILVCVHDRETGSEAVKQRSSEAVKQGVSSGSHLPRIQVRIQVQQQQTICSRSPTWNCPTLRTRRSCPRQSQVRASEVHRVARGLGLLDLLGLEPAASRRVLREFVSFFA